MGAAASSGVQRPASHTHGGPVLAPHGPSAAALSVRCLAEHGAELLPLDDEALRARDLAILRACLVGPSSSPGPPSCSARKEDRAPATAVSGHI